MFDELPGGRGGKCETIDSCSDRTENDLILIVDLEVSSTNPIVLLIVSRNRSTASFNA